MASFSDIIKAVIDKQTISRNKWLIMWVIAALGGGSGTIAQTFNLSSLELTRQSDIREVAKGFQSIMAEAEPKAAITTKIIVQKTSCGKCSKLLNSHIQEYH